MSEKRRARSSGGVVRLVERGIFDGYMVFTKVAMYIQRAALFFFRVWRFGG